MTEVMTQEQTTRPLRQPGPTKIGVGYGVKVTSMADPRQPGPNGVGYGSAAELKKWIGWDGGNKKDVVAGDVGVHGEQEREATTREGNEKWTHKKTGQNGSCTGMRCAGINGWIIDVPHVAQT